MTEELLEELRWKKFPVLDDGFVCLVDVMGDDSSVIQAARVSYGRDVREESTTRNDEEIAQHDEKTLRYLMRHRHTTPFEMCELKFLVRCPMDVWRQWIRHRTANVNEYSTRYTEAIDSAQKTASHQWRLQSGTNKQGSGGYLEANLPSGAMDGGALTLRESQFHEACRSVYRERLDAGVAREQARKDLPLSTYTEAYWKIDLHNCLHFLGLRMDSHAQLEIRQYAIAMGEQIVAKLFPVVWRAFVDYRLEAMTLSRMEVAALRKLLTVHSDATLNGAHLSGMDHGLEGRELSEWFAKLGRLGIEQAST